jgi:YesN/AraC family two-component response regulator
MRKGDLCFIEPGMENYESYSSAHNPYVLTWFLLVRTSFASMHQSVYGHDGSFRITNQQHVFSSKQIKKTVDLIIQQGKEQKTGNWQSIKKDLLGIFKFWSSQKVIIKKVSTNRWHKRIAGQVEQYLQEHLVEKITLQQVADRFFYHPAYLDTLFKNEYGQGIIDYVIFLRICRAASLLLRSTLPVNEIARRCGYEDPYYFSRIFRKNLGLSPQHYRNEFS